MTARRGWRSRCGRPGAMALGRLLVMWGALVGVTASPTGAADPERDEVGALREEVRTLREENAASKEAIRKLEERLAEVESSQATRIEEIDRKLAEAPPSVAAAPPGDRLTKLFGDNRFLVTGWGSAGYDWESREGTNTFGATLAPILLFRVGERVLFEAEPEFELASDETELNLEYAQADVLLNDYATLVAGKFLLPFGEFIQQLHPAWINKLASNPLPYLEGEEGGLLPFSDIGFQLRGGARLFETEGVDLDYSLYVTNGPRFEDAELGAPLVSNNTDLNKGKGFGARLAVYPLPLARELGRLKIGASTYNGTWDEENDLWFTSWGLDFAYQYEELELRGEYLQTRRDLLGMPADRRNGWYLQAAYKLSRLQDPHLSRMALVLRYSGLSQKELFSEEEDEVTRLADPQQIAFGLDYWFTPSVVGKLEYDLDFARRASTEHALRAQIAIGF